MKKVRIGYNIVKDAYEVLTSGDGGKTWRVELSCVCTLGKNQHKNDEPMYVNIEIIGALKFWISRGYAAIY